MEREKLVQLVTAAQRGDPGAMDSLFNRFYDDVYYFALKTVKDTDLACDITQETFVELLNTIGNLQEPAAFVKWMKQITYHQCTRYFKKKKDILVEEDEDGNTVFDILAEDRTEFIPEEAMDQKDFRNTILAMLDGLSEEQRSATMLYYYDELPVKLIAQIQGVSEGTVKSRLNYARKALKSAVESYEKTNNVKLHSFAFLPFMLWLLTSTAEESAAAAAAAPGIAAGVSAATGVTVTAATAASASAGATAVVAAATGTVATSTAAATATTATAVGTGAAVAIPVVAKVVAVATAGVIALGGAGIAISNHRNANATVPTEPTHIHTWVAADCKTPKTCVVCGEVEGIALGHSWLEASCETPKTCVVCGEVEGIALGHSWLEASCETPKTCVVCGEVEGIALGHSWLEASCEAPKTCVVCGEVEGITLGHSWLEASCEVPKTCVVCGEVEGITLGHSWLEADCESPETCSVCGATGGAALGHHWLEATCQIAKTCQVCGLSDGEVLAHTYVDSYCSICGKWEFSEGLEYTLVDGGYVVSSIGTCTDTEILIPANHQGLPVVAIGGRAFSECRNIESIVIPEGVKSIGYGAFAECSSLREISIPSTMESIYPDVFHACNQLNTVRVEGENVHYCIDEYGVLFNKAKTELLFIPGTVTGVYVVPNTVVNISNWAICDSAALTEIWIPASVQYADGIVSSDCVNLEQIAVAEDNPYYSSDACGVLFDKDKTMLLRAPCKLSGEYSIPEGVVEIRHSAFRKCANLTQITIPASVATIENSTFWECSALTSIVIPEGITTIQNSAFCYCDGLISVTIPDSVTEIGDYAFYGCNNLQYVALSESSQLVSIGSKAFGGCQIAEVFIPAGVQNIGNNAFSICISTQCFRVAEENQHYSSDAYGVLFDKAKTVLIRAPGKLSGSYEIPDGVTTISDEAFWKCAGLTEITIPATVTNMGKYVFCECKGLTSVTIPEGVTVIGDHAFMNCIQLTSVSIPNTVATIEQYAFFSSGLKTIDIPGSVACIGYRAFDEDCEIRYSGTKAQWEAIEKVDGWHGDSFAAAIVCADEIVIV